MGVNRGLLAGVCGLLTASALFAGSRPLTVSPGNVSEFSLSEARCPAFSWGEVKGAESYQLVVYRLAEEGEESRPVLRETFAGSASSWTPSLDRCLERGGRYAWSIRAVGVEAASEWSTPSLFRVASRPSGPEFEAALQVVERYLRAEAAERFHAATDRIGSSSEDLAVKVGGQPGHRQAGPVARSAMAGDSALQVNGSPVLTAATSRNLLLCANTSVGGWRYWDLGDGTVLDCNTGKMWLRDASCLGKDTWEESGGNSIFTKVADLNSGTDFGCSGYTAGTYSDWTVPAMTDLCGLWNGSCGGTSCCTASAGIVDTGFFSPAVANAEGVVQWSEGDAFVGVQSTTYWSTSEYNATVAWRADLAGGNVAKKDKILEGVVWPVRGGQ